MKALDLLLTALPVVMLIVVSVRCALPYSYLLLLLSYAIIVSFTLTFLNDHHLRRCYKGFLVSVLVFTLLLRSLYMIRTGFNIEPLYDGYKNLVTTYIFSRAGHVHVIRDYYLLTYASSFPSLEVLTLTLSEVAEATILHSALLISLAIGFLMTITMFALVKHIATKLSLSQRYVMLCLVLIAVCPELIYYSMVYYPRHYCLALYYLLMYLILSCKFLPVALMLALALPLSYSLFPVMTVTLVFVLVLLRSLLRETTKKNFLGKHFSLSPSSRRSLNIRARFETRILLLLLVGECITMAYYVASTILQSNQSLIHNMLTFWTKLQKPIESVQLKSPYWIPPILRSPWNILVHFRDMLLYGPAVLGIIILTVQSISMKKHRELLLNLWLLIIAYAILHMIFVEGGRLRVQTTLHLTLYLILPLSALAYVYVISLLKKTSIKVIIVGLLTLIVLASGLALWSHRALLLHYYDTSIDLVEAGDHNPRYTYFNEYICDFFDPHFTRVIYSDDYYSLGLYVFKDFILNDNLDLKPLRIFLYHGSTSFDKGPILIVIFSNGNLLMAPYGWKSVDLHKLLQWKIETLKKVTEKGEILYYASSSMYMVCLRGSHPIT